MKHNYYLLFILLLISVDCYAQVQTRIFKASSLSSFVSNKKDNDFKFISISPLDLEEIRKEDDYNRQKGANERFGKSIPVAIGFEAGNWKIDKQRGGHTWFLNLTSKEAKGVIVHFDELSISDGAELYVYNSDKSMIYGPVTNNNSSSKNRFATDLIIGDSITLEFFEPVRS